MADQQFREEFFTAFKSSKTFALMNDTQKANVMSGYMHADDELLRRALKDLQDTEAEIHTMEDQYREGQNAKAESAKTVRDSLHDFQRADREESEALENKVAEKEVQKLLKEAEKVQPAEKKKRWGIF